MKNPSNYNYTFYISLGCAIWFLLTSTFWLYYACLFISFPFGFLSLYLWYKGRKNDEQKNRYKIIAALLISGTVTSIAVLIVLLTNN